MSKLYYILNDDQSQKTLKQVKFNKPTKKFFQEAKAFLNCPYSQKRQKIKVLEKTLLLYLQEHPTPSEEDLFDAFGTPEELANAIFSPQPYTEKLSRKRIWRLFFVLLVCCLLVITARCIYLQYYWNKSMEEDIGYSETITYSTKSDVEQLPDKDKYSIKYGLTYNFNSDYSIHDAFNSETGEPIDVDYSGKPLDPDYPLSEEYKNLPDE